MTETKSLPICPYAHRDCAARRDDVCIGLTSTYFRKGDCPFYKSKDQNKAENEAARQRLKDIGWCRENYHER